MAVLHWIVNFILLWNYLFFIGGTKVEILVLKKW